jgi:MoxR-like ATPase
MVATMNDDASTFDLPEYIHSRLQPQITLDFPERHEEYAILKENLPFGEEHILNYVTDFLQQAHAADERYTVRDGINIARYAIKLKSLATQRTHESEALEISIIQVLGEEALRYARRNRPSDS